MVTIKQAASELIRYRRVSARVVGVKIGCGIFGTVWGNSRRRCSVIGSKC